MPLNKSTLKTSLIMFVFQSVLLSLLALNVQDLQDLSEIPASLFWFFSSFSFSFYFYTTQSCPGFVTAKDLAIAVTGKVQVLSKEDKSDSFEIDAKPKTSSFNELKNDGADGQPANFNQPQVAEHMNTYRSEGDEEKEKTQNHIEDQVEDIKITEIRHCTVCRIDQPLRTKHCRECGKCIATHDHHCPWLGVCIGEKNKKRFYSYLVIQLGQLAWALALDLESFNSPGGVLSWFFFNSVRLVLALLLGLFALMIVCLIGFHFFLASINLTTWEYLSWQKISYLKALDWSKGSPFSQGVPYNLYDNCCKRIPKYLTMWELHPSQTSKI